MQPPLGAGLTVVLPVSIGTALVVLAALTGLWLWLGRGPRRRRAWQHAQRLLQQQAWQPALETVRQAQTLGPLSPTWEGRLRHAEGECHRVAADHALRDKRFEDALEHTQTAARLLNLDRVDARDRVIQALLREVRRLFAESTGPVTTAVQQLIDRLFRLESPCPEASFWRGLCHAREGQTDQALSALHAAQEGTGKMVLDPALYLGAVMLRQGLAQMALRHLADANRLESSCALVGWQLGSAILAAGGDTSLAIRALQRALGPQGLPNWIKKPERIWVEAMPGPARSFIHRLAVDHPFRCPVLGSDVAAMVRQAQFALAQAYDRIGNFAEAANLYHRLLQDSAPSLPVLRGLGLSLARLERYDEAYKHLRAAHEQEDPKDPITAGYLALCGALGKPSQPEDKPSNVAWAIRVLSRFHVPGNPEWARLCSAIFSEARVLGLRVAADDQQRLGEALVSIDAADPLAAGAYDHLAATCPDALCSEHAWLYCRAAQLHGFSAPRDLDLFERAFRDLAGAQAFFAQREWNFEEVEITYLERWAQQRPGRFPDVLGAAYAGRGECLLLERSRRQEEAGQTQAALASAATLSRLAPGSPAALDRLAYLHHRQGDTHRAVQLLEDWHWQHQTAYVPLVRRAVIEQQRGNMEACGQAVRRALQITLGKTRAHIAFLGARLAVAGGQREQAIGLLEECLKEQPDHVDALWLLAALRCLNNDAPGLTALAPSMQRAKATDARFHFLAGVCQLAAGNDRAAIEAARRIDPSDPLAGESHYVIGRAYLHQNDVRAATAAFEKTARPNGPSANHARALLGRLAFLGGDRDAAIEWWSALAPGVRSAWNFDEGLRGSWFVSGLLAHQAGRYEQAAERFREAAASGWRDRRLVPLLTLALFKAGQRRLFAHVGSNGETEAQRGAHAAVLLEQAIKAGSKALHTAYLLALAYKRQDNLREARNALRKIAKPDADVWLQLGLLSLREKQLAQAEQEFDQAWQLDGSSFDICHNLLLTRLSLGQVDAAAALVPRAIELAPDAEAQRLFTILQALLQTFAADKQDGRYLLLLSQMSTDSEQRLLHLVRSIGQLDTVCTLLRALLAARLRSPAVQEANLEGSLLKGRTLLDRCDWTGAERLLLPLTREKAVARPTQTALLNLLGCCACLAQEFKNGARHFAAALTLASTDARIQQNLALVHEWQGRLDLAAPYWDHYLQSLSPKLPAPPNQPDYHVRLEHEALCRLANSFSEKQQWDNAVDYLERAHQMQPRNADTLEKLFHLYNQLKRSGPARQVLAELKSLRPGEPQLELYELDIGDVRDIQDVERMILDIGQILQRHPGDPRVEERAVGMVGNVLPLMNRLCDQLTEQLNKVMEQVRNLPNYQINWSAVHEIMRDLKREFLKLRRITSKCLPLVTHTEHRRAVNELSEHIDRKIEFCKRWEGG